MTERRAIGGGDGGDRGERARDVNTQTLPWDRIPEDWARVRDDLIGRGVPAAGHELVFSDLVVYICSRDWWWAIECDGSYYNADVGRHHPVEVDAPHWIKIVAHGEGAAMEIALGEALAQMLWCERESG